VQHTKLQVLADKRISAQGAVSASAGSGSPTRAGELDKRLSGLRSRTWFASYRPGHGTAFSIPPRPARQPGCTEYFRSRWRPV